MYQEKTREILFKIGVPVGTKGFEYIVEAVENLIANPDISMTKELYPRIAQKYKTTPSAVEKAIRYAFKNLKIEEKSKHYTGIESKTNRSLMIFISLHVKKMCGFDLKEKYSNLLDENMVRYIVRDEIENHFRERKRNIQKKLKNKNNNLGTCKRYLRGIR